MVKIRAMYIIILLLLISLIISLPSTLAAEEKSNIYFDGIDVTAELDPQKIDGQFLVGARSLANNLNAEIEWLQSIKTLSLHQGKTIIKMMADNPYIQVNNTIFKTKSKLIIKDGRTYIPLKEVVEGFGYLVQQDNNLIYIFKPKSYVEDISWQKEGQQLFVKMDKLSPYRINKTADPKKIILEIDKAALAKDFKDGISNNNFYLKINKAANMARLEIIITSKHPIPFQLDGGVEEEGDNLIINFLPHINAINWKDDQLVIESNGEIAKPEIFLLSNPRRMVIDIPRMMLNNYDLNLPFNEWIKDIRVSQFKYDPVILRIVIELKEKHYLYLASGVQSKILVLKPNKITRVNDLHFSNNQIRFKTDQAINPDIFVLQNPDRLVINLLNTVRDKNFPDLLELDTNLVKRIRTSRFNEETVRIVADLTKLTGYNWKQMETIDGKYEQMIVLKNSLEGIKIFNYPEKTDINLSFSSKVDYEVKKFSYPDRLVVDVKGLVNNIAENELPKPIGLVKKIRVNQFSNKPQIMRIVFELDKFYSYEAFSTDNDRIVNLNITKAKSNGKKNIIVIDPGHGGFDPGAIGPSGLMEKELTLDIGLKVKQILKEKGYRVLLTREDDRFISLKERVNIANKVNARLFVSIHINAFNEEYSEGTETYLAPNKIGNSSLLASSLQEELIKELNRFDRGVKTGDLYVIKYTSMPASLVEVAFISNPHEEALLDNGLFRERAARAIVEGIVKYLEKTEQGDERSNE